jgi:hypothetical protein
MIKHNKPWFRAVRGSYLPISWEGWALYIPYALYIIAPLVFVLRRGYTFWQSLFIVLPNWVAAGAILTWIASRTARK